MARWPHQGLAGPSHHGELGESLTEDVLSLLPNLLAHTSHLDRKTMDPFQDAFFTSCLISSAGKEFWTIPGSWHAASPILPAARSTTQPIPPIYHPTVTITSHLSGDHDSPGTYTFWSFSQHPGHLRICPTCWVDGGGLWATAKGFSSRLSFQQMTCKWHVGKVVSRSSSAINQQSPTKDIKALLVYTIWEFGHRGGLNVFSFYHRYTWVEG